MRFRAASDQSMLIDLGDEIGLATHARVLKLLRLLQKEPPAWLRNMQPAYCSLLISFDASRVDHAAVETALRRFEQRSESLRSLQPRTIRIPVCYEGDFAPDIHEVARLHNLSIKDVIRIHTSRAYLAYFLGFVPGFAYLGDLSEDIATPRLDTPRKRVPAGSVGIAGKQTAVYPFATPGGWRLIGRTPLPLFRTDREPFGLISMGDQVRFRSISPGKFEELASP